MSSQQPPFRFGVQSGREWRNEVISSTNQLQKTLLQAVEIIESSSSPSSVNSIGTISGSSSVASNSSVLSQLVSVSNNYVRIPLWDSRLERNVSNGIPRSR